MNGLTFGSPIVLLVAALFSTAAWWAINREQHRRRRLLGSYGDESLLSPSSSVPSTREYLAALSLKTIAIALGLVALARPQLGDRPAALAHSGADVLVLLDLSRSMNAVDDSIPRLAQAKHGIGQVLAAAPENRVGLIVFGGSAFLQLPLTTNQAAFRRFLDAASTDDLGDPATSLASALTAAATTFEHDGERGYQSVLIVSDGESGRDDVGPPLTRLRRAGIPVFAVGVGSPQGAPVPADSTEAPEKWHRDHIGRIVVSHLEESDLKRATRETDGVYARWTPAGLASVARALSRQDKRIISSRESRERVDRFQWPLALSMVALGLVPLVGPSTRKRRK